jgi:hypothetical protein
MHIPDEIRKCVAFLYGKSARHMNARGTVFFVYYLLPNRKGWLSYAITAGHVLDGIQERGIDGNCLDWSASRSGAAGNNADCTRLLARVTLRSPWVVARRRVMRPKRTLGGGCFLSFAAAGGPAREERQLLCRQTCGNSCEQEVRSLREPPTPTKDRKKECCDVRKYQSRDMPYQQREAPY